MAALGLPTTRSLAAVMTGEPVMRERMLPGGVLTRVASSHLRVGTFQYFAAREDIESLRLLADYAISRHYPGGARRQRTRTWRSTKRWSRALAGLAARWMQIGFIHGVLNTDNTSIAGETIDYGPCAFMDAYHPRKVFSSIDRQGRYAYENQPAIVQWNLARLGECLLPLFSGDRDAALAKANEALGTFGTAYKAAYLTGFRRKLGLFEAHNDDEALISDLLTRMAEGGADFTLTFRALSDVAGNTAKDDSVRELFANPGCLRRLGFCLAGAPVARAANAARAWRRDEVRQSEIHSAQSSRRGRDCGGRARAVRSVRGAQSGACEPV